MRSCFPGVGSTIAKSGFSGTTSAMKPVDLYAIGQLFPQYTGFSLTPGERFSRTGSSGFVLITESPSREYLPIYGTSQKAVMTSFFFSLTPARMVTIPVPAVKSKSTPLVWRIPFR